MLKFYPFRTYERQRESVIVSRNVEWYCYHFLCINQSMLGWLNEKAYTIRFVARQKDASRVAIVAASCCAMRIFRNILRARVVRMTDTANFDTMTTGRILSNDTDTMTQSYARDEGFLATIPSCQVSRICRKFRVLKSECSIPYKKFHWSSTRHGN